MLCSFGLWVQSVLFQSQCKLYALVVRLPVVHRHELNLNDILHDVGASVAV